MVEIRRYLVRVLNRQTLLYMCKNLSTEWHCYREIKRSGLCSQNIRGFSRAHFQLKQTIMNACIAGDVIITDDKYQGLNNF